MTYDRGPIIFAADPFKGSNAGRPWVVINTSEMPFHDEQCLGMALTSKTWHDERIPIQSGDLTAGTLPKESSLLPWAIASIDPNDVQSEVATLDQQIVNEAVRELMCYVGMRPDEGASPESANG